MKAAHNRTAYKSCLTPVLHVSLASENYSFHMVGVVLGTI